MVGLTLAGLPRCTTRAHLGAPSAPRLRRNIQRLHSVRRRPEALPTGANHPPRLVSAKSPSSPGRSELGELGGAPAWHLPLATATSRLGVVLVPSGLHTAGVAGSNPAA